MSDHDPPTAPSSWAHPGITAHPNSPAGGTGPGRTRPGGPDLDAGVSLDAGIALDAGFSLDGGDSLDAGASRTPHHTSPAARHAEPPSSLDRLSDLLSLERIRDFLENLTVEESSWIFDTSTGVEVSLAKGLLPRSLSLSLAGGALWLKDGKQGVSQKFVYGGLGKSACQSGCV